MGIEEFVLDRERRLGEKIGLKKAEKIIKKEIHLRLLFLIRNLITETDFDDAKIATLAGVSSAFVKNIRLNIKK